MDPEGLYDLQKRIHQSALLMDCISTVHNNYMYSEINLGRLEKRKHLEDLVREYLSIVPPAKRFMFELTDTVLRDMICMHDLNFFGAARAWEAIVDYGANVLTQPWRREFFEIKMYNGFYKHYIEKNMVRGERMFKLMGYHRDGNNSTMAISGTLEVERVTAVALDAFLALVELQMMQEVMTDLIRLLPNHNVDILSIYSFRINNSGSVAETTATMFHTVNQVRMRAPPYHQTYQSNPMYPNPYLNHFTTNLESVSQGPWVYSAPQPFVHRSVPIAELIELDPPESTVPYVNFHKSAEMTTQDTFHGTFPLSGAGGRTRGECSPRRLRTQGRGRWPEECSKKRVNDMTDTACIGLSRLDDKIGSNVREECMRKRAKDVVNKVNNDLHRSSRPRMDDKSGSTGSEECIKKRLKDMVDQAHNDLRRSSRSSNWPPEPLVDIKETQTASNGIMMKPESTLSLSDVRTSLSKLTLENNDLKSSNDGWSCLACTYYNKEHSNVCSMCYKSRHQGSEQEPLTTGGLQCSKCTVINTKDRSVCMVCGTSLEDSATYI